MKLTRKYPFLRKYLFYIGTATLYTIIAVLVDQFTQNHLFSLSENFILGLMLSFLLYELNEAKRRKNGKEERESEKSPNRKD